MEINLLRKLDVHFYFSANTSAVKTYRAVSGSFHASGGKPAFWLHNCDKNSSLLHPVSSATCGRNTP